MPHDSRAKNQPDFASIHHYHHHLDMVVGILTTNAQLVRGRSLVCLHASGCEFDSSANLQCAVATAHQGDSKSPTIEPSNALLRPVLPLARLQQPASLLLESQQAPLRPGYPVLSRGLFGSKYDVRDTRVPSIADASNLPCLFSGYLYSCGRAMSRRHFSLSHGSPVDVV